MSLRSPVEHEITSPGLIPADWAREFGSERLVFYPRPLGRGKSENPSAPRAEFQRIVSFV